MRSILLVPALLLSGCALTQQSTPIQPDANWHVNQLSNGMKYHIYPTQDQEVSVRLVMHIGSFQEEANQKGYAHFVEHMAFNGSTHLPATTLLSFLSNLAAVLAQISTRLPPISKPPISSTWPITRSLKMP